MVVQLEWLQQEIADILIHDIEKGKITEGDGEKVAGIVLEKIQNVKNEADLERFMDELGTIYDGFGNLQAIVHGKMQKHIEDKVANQILQLVKKGATKQAVDLAKQQME